MKIYTRALLALALCTPITRAAALDRAAIEHELRDVSQSGIDHRLGPDYDALHPTQTEKFPEIYLAESKQEESGRRYQIGGPWSKKAGYSFD